MKLLKVLVLLAFLSGNAASGQTPDAQLEIEIYRQLLPALADSLFLDFREFPPPPPPPLPKEASRQERIAYQKQAEAHWKAYEESLKELEKDTSTFVLAVSDSTYTRFDKADLDQFRAHFNLSEGSQIDTDTLSEFRMDLEKILPQQKFRFKYRSEFPEGRGIWGKEHDFLFSGVISFSRILFDESRSYGVLTGAYACGRLCGHCVRIFIKRVDGTWEIEEIAVTCIS